MIRTIDKVRLDTSAQLSLETGYTMGWSPESATYLTKLEGWTGSAPVRRNKADRLGAHGSHAERGWKDERLISVSSHHVAADRFAAATYAEEIAAFLGDGEAGIFRVDDVSLGSRWARVYLATGGVDVQWDGGLDVSSTVHMLAPDPRKYGAATFSTPTGVPTPGKGLRFPLFGGSAAGVLDIGRGGYPGRTSVTNRGMAATGPRFTITGYVPGFTITDIATGRRLVYAGTVEVGQTLVLDANTGTATMDGYAPRGSKLVVADWTTVPPKATATWLFEAPGSTGAVMSVEVTPAWW